MTDDLRKTKRYEKILTSGIPEQLTKIIEELKINLAKNRDDHNKPIDQSVITYTFVIA